MFGEIFDAHGGESGYARPQPDAPLESAPGDWKLISFEETPAHAELYNVKVDPFEEHNLAGENSQKVAELRQRINAWWKANK